MFWGGGPIPLLAELSMRSFVANGHPVEFYAYEDYDLPEGVDLRNASDFLSAKERDRFLRHSDGKMANVSDLFRCRMLYEKGGYWSDSDMVCLRPWTFHEKAAYMFAGSYHAPWELRKGISACAMLVPPGSALMKECVSRVEQVLLEPHAYPDAAYAVEALVRAHGLWKFVGNSRDLGSVRWWQTNKFARKIHAFSLPNNAHGIHCYMFRWIQSMERAKERHRVPLLDIHRVYPEDTLIGFLQRKYL